MTSALPTYVALLRLLLLLLMSRHHTMLLIASHPTAQLYTTSLSPYTNIMDFNSQDILDDIETDKALNNGIALFSLDEHVEESFRVLQQNEEICVRYFLRTSTHSAEDFLGRGSVTTLSLLQTLGLLQTPISNGHGMEANETRPLFEQQ